MLQQKQRNKESPKGKDAMCYLFQSKFLLLFSSPLLGLLSRCFQLSQYRKYKISNANQEQLIVCLPLLWVNHSVKPAKKKVLNENAWFMTARAAEVFKYPTVHMSSACSSHWFIQAMTNHWLGQLNVDVSLRARWVISHPESKKNFLQMKSGALSALFQMKNFTAGGKALQTWSEC